MVKKLIGLSSLLLIITFIGAACAPAASQSDLQALQYQVQTLSQSLASTQSSLQATQATLQSVQLQNQQLQEQLKQTSSTCSTCEKTAQTCINYSVVNAYGCVSIAPYCSNPCSTPIAYPPCSWLYSNYYFLPYHFTHYGPWGYHPFPPPAPPPGPPPFPPPPHPWPWTSPSVTLPQPITAYTPRTEPMATSQIFSEAATAIPSPEITPLPSLAVPALTAMIDTTEPTPDMVAATEPASGTTVDVSVSVLETTPYAPIATEPLIIISTQTAPETLQTPEAANEPAPGITIATYASPDTTPAVTYSAAPTVETAPPAPAIPQYPAIYEAPAAPVPPAPEMVNTVDKTETDPALQSITN